MAKMGDLSGRPNTTTVIGRSGLPSAGRQMDPAIKRLMMNIAKARIMGDPKLRNIVQGMLFARNPSKQAGLNFLVPQIQRAGIMSLIKKHGPSALYALINRGGAFGLGTGGPLGQGVLPSLAMRPLNTIGRMKFAAANPLLGLLMAGLNKASPQIAGQKGPLGGSLGPQLANLFAPLFGGRDTAEAQKLGTGILGGTLGPRIRNALGIGQRSAPQATRDSGTGIFGGTLGPKLRSLFGMEKRSPSIEEFDMSTLPTKRGSTGEVFAPINSGYVPSPSMAFYSESGFSPGQGKK